MRPFGKFYSAHHSAHVKWRVPTHSDRSCCELVSERHCNLICLSCEVKAFIISARGIRCHLHWTWHVHVLLQPWDSRTQTRTGESCGRRDWKTKGFKEVGGQNEDESTADGKAKVGSVRVGCGGQGDRSCWRLSETQTHTNTQRATSKWLRSADLQGGGSDDGKKWLRSPYVSLRRHVRTTAKWPSACQLSTNSSNPFILLHCQVV